MKHAVLPQFIVSMSNHFRELEEKFSKDHRSTAKSWLHKLFDTLYQIMENSFQYSTKFVVHI